MKWFIFLYFCLPGANVSQISKPQMMVMLILNKSHLKCVILFLILLQSPVLLAQRYYINENNQYMIGEKEVKATGPRFSFIRRLIIAVVVWGMAYATLPWTVEF